MNLFKTLAMVGLVGVGMAYGENGPKKTEVTVINDIGDNGRKEVALINQMESLVRLKTVDKTEFNDLLKQFCDLMVVGRTTSPDWIGGEIFRQTHFFLRANYVWSAHPELQDQTTTVLLKGMSDAINTMIKEHQIPNYTNRPCTMLSGTICGEPSQEWKDYVRKNKENCRENMTQNVIKHSAFTINMCTQNIDKAIAEKGFNSQSKTSPIPQ